MAARSTLTGYLPRKVLFVRAIIMVSNPNDLGEMDRDYLKLENEL